MTVIDTLTYYLNIVFVISMVVLVVLGGLVYYFLKIKKVTAKVEQIDYSSFTRIDAREYAKFEDIIAEDTENLKSPAMIAVGNNTYVAGLSITGYVYSTSSAEERQRSMINAIAFCNIIEKPIQLRQTVKAMELSHNIQVHEELLHKAAMEHMTLSDEYEETSRMAEDYIGMPEFEEYEKKLVRLRRSLAAKKHEVEELEMLIRYMNLLTGGKNKETQKINQIMFSWTYNPDEYTEELSKEEIELKAMQELATMARSYSDAYVKCGYSCKRLTAQDLVMLMHRHMHPLTSDDLKLEDLLNSSCDALFVSSDSLIEMERERIGEEAFKRRLEEALREQDEQVRKKNMEFEHTVQEQRKDIQRKVNEAEAVL